MASLRIIDDAARFFLDPSNKNYSAPKKAAAWITTVLLCFATLGTVQLLSAVWRSCRHIQEKNDTHEKISGVFHRVFCQKSSRNDENFLKNTSRYASYTSLSGPALRIELIKRGIKVIPEFHLFKFTDAIKECIATNRVNPHLEVSFLLENRKRAAGLDYGGLSRDYLDDLAEGVAKSAKGYFKIIDSTGLAIPQARQKDRTDGQLSVLDKEESNIYNALGALMMFCYHSKSYDVQNKTYQLGRHFDEAIFSAALCLTAEEINTSFDNLSLKTLLKMSMAILFAQEASGDAMAGTMGAWVNRLQEFASLSNTQLMETAQDMANLCLLPKEFQKNGEEDVPDLEKISNNRIAFENSFKDFVFSQNTSFGQLGNMLAPMHAIACGMKSTCSKTADSDHEWDARISMCSYSSFSNKIQGSLDRDVIANQLQIELHDFDPAYYEIRKKVQWLKEWIRDANTTEKEVKNLLKFVTGSNSLPAGKTISVIKQRPEDGFIPIPRAHTCSFSIELAPLPCSCDRYNDSTKEAFIDALRNLILSSDEHSYQTN